MFVTGPNVVKTVTQEDVTQEDLGGADTHTSISGVAHGAFDDDITALRGLRELYEYLPLNNKEEPPIRTTHDSKDRSDESLRLAMVSVVHASVLSYLIDCVLAMLLLNICYRYLVPDDANTPYEMSAIIKKVVDDNTLFEIMPNYAKNIICGFARMNGRTVGVSCCYCCC